ncbi:MAG: hypothetical protein RLZZ350_2584 [Verrucomicrobiota bacterium]|jgi:hypothetical protein
MKTKSLFVTFAAAILCATRLFGQISVDTVATSDLHEPCSVTADPDGNFYVADSVNHRIARLDGTTFAVTTLAGLSGSSGAADGPVYLAQFFTPQALLYITLAGTNGLVVADTGNHSIRFVNLTNGSVFTLAGSTGTAGSAAVGSTPGSSARFRSPTGLSLDRSNNLYIADSGNNAIRVLNLTDPTFAVTTVAVANTTFFQPNGVAIGNPNELWVADTRHHAIKRITLTSAAIGTMTTRLGSDNQNQSGITDSIYGANARFSNPRGLLWLGNGSLLIADTANHTVRLATNYTVIGATNFAVSTFVGSPGTNGFANGSGSAVRFNSPFGISADPFGNDYLIADLNNNAIRRLQNGPVQAPVATPQIGWVDLVKDSGTGAYFTKLQTGSPFVFNNDVKIAILAENATETFFTTGDAITLFNDNVPAPGRVSGNSAPTYHDGMPESQYANIVSLANPGDGVVGASFSIKAIGLQSGRRPSAVSAATFSFNTANPQIIGNNAAQFTVTDISSGAEFYYTTNGSDPTNLVSASVTRADNNSTFHLDIGNSSVTFKVRAFKANYKPSEVITKNFSATNYIPNRISFGFASGEASSDFVASPGQSFYAPVTLSLLSGTRIMSLQFNMTVSNLLTAPPVTSGAYAFGSMLQKPHPADPTVLLTIPPAMFIPTTLATNVTVSTNVVGTNVVVVTNTSILTVYSTNPPPNSQIIFPWVYNPSAPFLSLTFSQTNANLLGVGWFERANQANLYDTTKQTLVSLSRAHDTVFNSGDGKVIVGGYAFLVPSAAVAGHQYQIRLGRPSATSDGLGANGGDVFIEATTNATLTGGSVNAVKNVTIGQRKYVVGDANPFRWFNAGDFGNNNLLNDDVEQVFQSAVYDLNTPQRGSDFYDSMDSCCVTYTNAGNYLAANTTVTGAALNPLFNGNDTSINNYAFGDGVLDVTDVFVTFRRSLDPSLVWFRRFWTNGVLGAEITTNQYRVYARPADATTKTTTASFNNSSTETPAVIFTAGDAVTGPGQTIYLPITANVRGAYPLRLLALNLSVMPLDGSPAITTPVVFMPIAALGAPTTSMSHGPGNYSAAWLNTGIAGISDETVIGALQITLPTNAAPSSAYAVSFDHASGSPNGLAKFPKQIFAGLITLADRSSSSANDGISDAWRLRWFGTVNNVLSAPHADADGDGADNLAEFRAGTNPNNIASVLRLNADKDSARNPIVRWPSISGKHYIIERSFSLYGNGWTSVSTNLGTGGDLQFSESGSGNRFYRVRVE